MINPEFVKKFTDLERNISSIRGDFALFALFLREDVPDRWDLIVSAPWASADKSSALDYFVTKIKSDIGPQGLIDLSRIVFIDPKDATVEALNNAINVEHGLSEVRDSNFFGLAIKHAFIITSKKAPVQQSV
jgi:hypothetical protein